MKPRAVSIVLRESRVLLVWRRKLEGEYYTLPGRSVEPGETLARACVRELWEETGLTGAIVEVLWTIVNRGRLEHYFLMSEVSGQLRLGGPEASDNAAHNEYELTWVDVAQLRDYPLKPKLIQNRLTARFGTT